MKKVLFALILLILFDLWIMTHRPANAIGLPGEIAFVKPTTAGGGSVTTCPVTMVKTFGGGFTLSLPGTLTKVGCP